MQQNLADKVFAFTEEKSLFHAPCHVLVGLSGGADSMALLHLLTHWPISGLRVSAVHIHHGLRGEEADRDEAFVRNYCTQHQIGLTVIHADVSGLAQQQQLSLEEAGRRVRYEQFELVRAAVEADYVLTAHTATDHAETVLMHMVRGCGVGGLAGIPHMRGRIRRPLLCCNRHEIEEYCRLNNLPFVTDSTNFDTKYTRNEVRYRLMPLLRDMNPSIESALLRLSRCAYEESAYLDDLATTALRSAIVDDGYRADAFTEQSAVIRRRMIRLMLRQCSVPTIEEVHILSAEKVIFSGNGSVDLSGSFAFVVQQDVASVMSTDAMVCVDPIDIESLPCTICFSNQTYHFSVQSDNIVHNLLVNCAVDCDKIQGKLCLRNRQTGDYLHAAGRGVGKSLKKWMNEWHIPAHIRDTYPVLCDDAGVVSVLGYACDERVRATEDTKHFLVCTTVTELG